MADLAERMQAAGMFSIEQMLERSPIGAFQAHAGVTDLEKFEEWIQMRRREFLTMHRVLQRRFVFYQKDKVFATPNQFGQKRTDAGDYQCNFSFYPRALLG